MVLTLLASVCVLQFMSDVIVFSEIYKYLEFRKYLGVQQRCLHILVKCFIQVPPMLINYDKIAIVNGPLSSKNKMQYAIQKALKNVLPLF